ncbi:MAG: cytochrome c [Nannocystaceae bacterium]
MSGDLGVGRRALALAGLLATATATSLACAPPPPTFTEDQVLGGVVVPVEELNTGARLYALHCASCHGVDGSGRGPAARHLDPGPRDFREARFLYKSTPGDDLPTDDDLIRVLVKGVPDRGMPPWKGMQPSDHRALVSYIKTFSPRWREPAGDPQQGPRGE